MSIGIGIDTGGTYTDAVLYDFERAEILGTAKALTTPDDLSRGILSALDALPQEPVRAALMIALSTTLATNACVQDRGGRAKLIFLGGNRKVIDAYGHEYGLPPANEMYLQDSHTTFSGGVDREMDWDALRKAVSDGFADLDGVGIVEANAVRNSAVVEKQAKADVLARYDVPVVCGHELFNELNSLQRGASALLNAQLVPVIRSFLLAIKTALAARGITAPVVIVRSDGGLMSEEFARIRPVETLLCGPAASVLGSARLTDEANCIVVDMGGTTTDIALVENHVPAQVVDGVRVGKWKTFVNGLFVHTFGLGGDTAIHHENERLLLRDYRVMPLCVAAHQHPRVLDHLRELNAQGIRHTRPLHEHYLLLRDIAQSPRYTDEEKAFCAALESGPLSLRQAGQAIPGRDMYNLNVTRLVKDGVVQLCGLTPTDIMHITGDFDAFSGEASHLAAQFVADNLNLTKEELCKQVYDQIKRRMYEHIVRALLEHQDAYYRRHGIGQETERLIQQCYEQARSGGERGPLSLQFKTDYVLAGVGAPIGVFLNDVAAMLGTRAVTPPHHEVANALGAVVGNVMATTTVDIRPINDEADTNAYRVFGIGATRSFKTKVEAEAFAVTDATQAARMEAIKRGAKGEIAVTNSLSDHEAQARHSMVYLGTRVTARAVGPIGLSGQ